MAYSINPGSGHIGPPPPYPLQTSAKWWRDLQVHNASLARDIRRRPSGVRVRMGAQSVILPAFSRIGPGEGVGIYSPNPRFMGMGDDDSLDSLLSGNPFMTEGNSGAESELSTPAELMSDTSAATASGAYLPYNLPLSATGSALVPGSVAYNAAQSSKAPGTPGYNALISAGLTAAQIAAWPGVPATTAPAAAAAAGQIVPGLSNSALLIGGAIVLIILGGKKK